MMYTTCWNMWQQLFQFRIPWKINRVQTLITSVQSWTLNPISLLHFSNLNHIHGRVSLVSSTSNRKQIQRAWHPSTTNPPKQVGSLWWFRLCFWNGWDVFSSALWSQCMLEPKIVVSQQRVVEEFWWVLKVILNRSWSLSSSRPVCGVHWWPRDHQLILLPRIPLKNIGHDKRNNIDRTNMTYRIWLNFVYIYSNFKNPGTSPKKDTSFLPPTFDRDFSTPDLGTITMSSHDFWCHIMWSSYPQWHITCFQQNDLYKT